MGERARPQTEIRNTLSPMQREAMRIMDEENLNAVFAAGRWIWREDVRTSEEAAARVLAAWR